MSRVIYVGGFSCGQSSVDGVAEALEEYFEEPVPFTLSNALKTPKSLEVASRKVAVITHSAGLLAIAGARPEFIHAFSAPIPTSILRLPWRTLVKTARLHLPGIGITDGADIKNVLEYNISGALELAGNLKCYAELFPEIAKFDSVSFAKLASLSGSRVNLVTTDKDAYFNLSQTAVNNCRTAGVGVVKLAGEHDELPLRPVRTLARYFSTIA